METKIPSLGRQAATALRWNSAAALATLFSQLIQIIFLARWLTPAQFGLAAAALSVSGFLQGFGDLGLTSTLIQKDHVSSGAWSTALWSSALAGLILAGLLAVASPGIAALLHLPGLTVLVAASALCLPWTGSAMVFQAHLQRHLRFRRLAAGEILAATASLTATLAWVWWRRDPMALVAGQIVLCFTRCAALGMASSLRPRFHLRGSELRPLSAFGGYQMAERALNYATGNLDRLLVARLLGPAATGYYTMASQIALRPIALLGPFVTRTLFPLLARLQAERGRLASSYLRSVSLLSFLAAAIYALLFGLAEPLLRAALGPGWDPAVPALRVLCVLGFLAVLGNAFGNLTLAVGRFRIGFWLNVFVLAIRIAGVYVGSFFGLGGVAAGVLLGTVLSLPADFFLPRRWLGIPARAIARANLWALLPACVSAIGMLLLIRRLPAVSPWAQIMLCGAAGCALFAATAWIFQRRSLRGAIGELNAKLRA